MTVPPDIAPAAGDLPVGLASLRDLVTAAVGLGARQVAGWSEAETALARLAGAGPVRRGAACGGAVRGGVACDGPVRAGPVRDGPVRDGPVRDGPVRDGVVCDGLGRGGVACDGPVRDGVVRDGVVRDGVVCDGLGRGGVGCGGVGCDGRDCGWVGGSGMGSGGGDGAGAVGGADGGGADGGGVGCGGSGGGVGCGGADGDLAGGLRVRIQAGEDPLGEAFTRLRSQEQRRALGQTYTPPGIVDAMVGWAGDQDAAVARVVDPGAGSARYLVAAGRRFPGAELIGCEIDPLAALLARANLAAAGLADRSRIVVADFRSLRLPPSPSVGQEGVGQEGVGQQGVGRQEVGRQGVSRPGITLYLGNPPYVRHHQISAEWKQWLLATAKAGGLKASALAGLHAYFFLAVAEQAAPGDLGCLITSAEWLDVNYGSLIRQLVLGRLGGTGLHILEPKAFPFSGTATTGAITCFRIGSRPSGISIRRVGAVADLGRLPAGRPVSREHLAAASRWSVLTHHRYRLPAGHVELGDLCQVHRGAVTGANAVWVTSRNATSLPDTVLFPAVTRARELFAAGDRLRDDGQLRVVIGLPADLGVLADAERALVMRFLNDARRRNVHRGYIASARKAWWSVQLRAPAPILATYMARRPPAFVRNDIRARHINIAHGLYPRQPLAPEILDRLAAYLRSAVTQAQGRTYAGGLTKFEPREMERLAVPGPALLAAGQGAPAGGSG